MDLNDCGKLPEWIQIDNFKFKSQMAAKTPKARIDKNLRAKRYRRTLALKSKPELAKKAKAKRRTLKQLKEVSVHVLIRIQPP